MTVASRLSHQTRGFLPVPVLIVFTYAVIVRLLAYLMFSLTVPDLYEFWSMPRLMDLNLLELLSVVDFLLAGYLVVSLLSLAMEKNGRTFRAISHWVSYILAFVLLTMVHLFLQSLGNNFTLPDELVKLRASGEFEYRKHELEDVVLPKSSMCQGNKMPLEERCILTITRPGHFVENRRDLGDLNAALPRIREKLNSHKSDTIVLIRADYKAEFKHIHDVMQLCKENEIEWACYCDLEAMAPEAFKDLKWPYWLPEGKLDVPFPKVEENSELFERIDIHVYRDKKEKLGFHLLVNNTTFKGDRMMDDFNETMKALHVRIPDIPVAIRAHDRVEHGHIIRVYSACLNAGWSNIHFDHVPNPL